MDYEKKYKEALERARDLMTNQNPPAFDKDLISLIFPKLKESEDDSIRNGLIALLKFGLEDNSAIAPGFNVTKEQTLAWLEKQDKQTHAEPEQSEVDQTSEQELGPKFRPGDWIIDNEYGEVLKVTKSDANSYEITNQDGEVFNILKEDVECNHRLWTIEDAKDGDVLATSAGAFIYNGNNGGGSCPGSYCGINTLGDFQIGIESHWTGKNVYPATKEQRELLFQKMKEFGYKWDSEKKELKTIEQKSADKVETKFKEGDYIVSNIDDFLEIWRVINIDKYGYYNIQCINNPEYDEIYRVPGFVLEQDYRRWTIQDARDGDVLVCNINKAEIGGDIEKLPNITPTICIYQNVEKDQDYIHSYCSLYNESSLVLQNRMYYNAFVYNIHPATKEQCDLLFQKMKETGYEWDSDKKEPKKIEVVSKESENEKIKKELIAFIKKRDKSGCDYDYDKWIAWLKKQGHMLDPDKVIEWIDDQACQGWIEDIEVDKFVDKFKRHFGL